MERTCIPKDEKGELRHLTEPWWWNSHPNSVETNVSVPWTRTLHRPMALYYATTNYLLRSIISWRVCIQCCQQHDATM